MIVLADGLSVLGWAAVLVIIAIVRMISAAASAGKNAQTPAGPPRQNQPPARGGETEEERTRRFLEALGLPATGVEPVRTAPPPLRAPTEHPRDWRREQPVPPIVARGPLPPKLTERDKRRLEESRRRLAQAEAQKEEALYEARARSHETIVGKTHLAPLHTRELSEFHTYSSEVTAIPFEQPSSVAGEVYREDERAIVGEIRRLVSSPLALRSAVLLREILGPPRGLQSSFGGSTLPPL